METIQLAGTESFLKLEKAAFNTVRILVHYGDESTGYAIHLDKERARGLYSYLDMENVPPYRVKALQSPEGVASLTVVQEADGRTWVRVYDTENRGRLTFLPDEETGRLYDWLGDYLNE